MSKRNVKTVKITVPNGAVLDRINSTPALRNCTRLQLVVGDNIEKVNHYQLSQQTRMLALAGCKIEEQNES